MTTLRTSRQLRASGMTGRALTVQGIERAIHLVRGHRIMLDADLARLYGVETGALNRAVKRNRSRFPSDFMFQITAKEVVDLKCQFGISSGHGGRRRSNPYAFTEHGVVMLSSVLNSPRAVAVNIEVVRVFVRLRHSIAANAELALRLAAVEASLNEHRSETGGHLAEHERRIRMILEAIQQLMDDSEASTEPPSPIGFQVGDSEKKRR
jgi:hypothetical protein